LFKVRENIFILEFKRVYHVKMGPLIVLMVAIPLLLNGYSIERKSRDINIQSLETARKGWNNLEQVVESFEDALHIDFQDLHLGVRISKMIAAGFDTTSVQGKAVKYNPEQMTWDGAEASCKSFVPSERGHLITVDTNDTFDWVSQQEGQLWIGANDKSTENTFTWVATGNNLTAGEMSHFPIGEPNDDRSGEDCIEANIPGKGDWTTWNDLDCETSRAYACEIIL